MDALFISRVVLSFFIAGSWIALVTLLAERLGSRLGGLFTNLPSNILISLIFIAVSKDISFVIGMMPAVPIGMLINTVFLLVMVFFIAEKRMRIIAVPGSGKRYTPVQMVIRAVFAGAIVAGVVLVSHFVPPYLTGIISTFPAVLFSTMVILYLSQGAAFARATGKVMLLSSSNIVVYGVSVYYTFPAFGIAVGTLVSLFFSLLWVLLLSPFMVILSKTND
jgi:hypothetical protein